jgi:hypothetical protein
LAQVLYSGLIMPSLWIAIAYWTVMAAYNSWGAKDAIMVAFFISGEDISTPTKR